MSHSSINTLVGNVVDEAHFSHLSIAHSFARIFQRSKTCQEYCRRHTASHRTVSNFRINFRCGTVVTVPGLNCPVEIIDYGHNLYISTAHRPIQLCVDLKPWELHFLPWACWWSKLSARCRWPISNSLAWGGQLRHQTQFATCLPSLMTLSHISTSFITLLSSCIPVFWL